MGKIEKVNKLAEKGKTDKIVSMAYDKEKDVRLAVIKALRKTPETEDSLNTLIGMLDDEDPEIRREVAVTLGCSKSSYVETHLRYCLSHEKDETVLDAIRHSLANIKKTVE